MIKSIKQIIRFKPNEILIQAIKSNRDSVLDKNFDSYKIFTKNKKVLEHIQHKINGELLHKRINTLDKNGTLIGGKKYNSNGDIIETPNKPQLSKVEG